MTHSNSRTTLRNPASLRVTRTNQAASQRHMSLLSGLAKPTLLLLLTLPACVTQHQTAATRTLSHTVGPVPTHTARGWASRTSIESSKFDVEQQSVVGIPAPGPFYTTGPAAVQDTELQRFHQAVSYSNGRFVMEGLLGASTLDVGRWQADGPNLSVGTRLAARLAEIEPFAVGASFQLTHNQADTEFSAFRYTAEWYEADIRLAAAALTKPDGSWPSPYAGIGHRRMDGKQLSKNGSGFEPEFEAELTYGFVGVAMQWLRPTSAFQLSAEAMLGDIEGVEVAMTFTF